MQEQYSASEGKAVSLSEQMDTTTPAGKMVFTVLGAVARVGALADRGASEGGLRNAKAKGKRLGRPRMIVDASQIGRLRAQGRTMREIASELGYTAAALSIKPLRIASFPPLQTQAISDK